MNIGVEISVDVTKLDKSRFVIGKNGGKYLVLTGFINNEKEDQYGNHGFLTEKLTKEEREAKVKRPIVGNSKVFWSDSQQAQQSYQQPQQQAPQAKPDEFDEFDDDIPF